VSIKFEFLPNAGEAILITIDNKFTILMDGGNSHPFIREFSKLRIPVPRVDMVIVTHIDKDHIGGIIQILKDKTHLNNIKHLLFNEPEKCNLFYSPSDGAEVNNRDGSSLLKLLEENCHINYIKSIHTMNAELEDKLSRIIPNTKVKILSPSPSALEKLFSVWNPSDFKQESDVSAELLEVPSGDIPTIAQQQYKLDSDISNNSSIALLLTHENKNYLLLGDAHITQINKSLVGMGFSEDNPLHLQLIKLSHHGSIGNINKDFLQLVRTNQYIICNPSAASKRLPNRETIAQIAFYGKSIKNDESKKILLTKKSNADLEFNRRDHIAFNFEISYQANKLEF